MNRGIPPYSVIAAFVALWISLGAASAQRLVDGQVRYGDEWIDEDASYLRVTTAEEGIHRITAAQLAERGWTGTRGSELRVLGLGEEIRTYVSTEGLWGADDYLEFVVEEQPWRAYDAELFGTSVDRMLNPYYRTFTDTLTYFLERGASAAPLRYTELDPPMPTGDVESTTFFVENSPKDPIWFHKRSYNKDGATRTTFVEGEGWDMQRTPRAEYTGGFRLDGYDVGTPAYLELRTRSLRREARSDPSRRRRVTLNGVVIDEREVDPDSLQRDTWDITDRVARGVAVTLKVDGLASSRDRYAIGAVRFTYGVKASDASVPHVKQLPRDFDRPGVVFAEALTAGETLVAYHLERGTSFRYAVSSGAQAIVPTGGQAGERVAFTYANQVRTPELGVAKFGEPVAAETDYLIVTNRALDDWSTNPTTYAQMRAEPRMGGYTPQIVYVDELDDRYGYGLRGDARGIRSAFQYGASLQPELLCLIIGKARAFTDVRTPRQRQDPENATNFVPTYGTPGADNPYGINPFSGRMSVSIGRLSVETSDELAVLLDKAVATVDALEAPHTLEGRGWMKRNLHLGGGKDAPEQLEIKNRLERAEAVWVNSEVAGRVDGYYKTSDIPIQEAENEAIYRNINEGTQFIVAFGHGSSTSFDFDINRPSRYENEGRYPIMVALGCYSGGVSEPAKSIGEEFVLREGKMTAGYISSVGLGYKGVLEPFIKQLYDEFSSGEGYEKPIGWALRRAVNRELGLSNVLSNQMAEQMLLQGDPALMMYRYASPDYLVDYGSAALTDATPSVADTLTLGIDIVNLGRDVTDSVEVLVYRATDTRPRELIDSIVVTPSRFRTPLSLSIAPWQEAGAGRNVVSLELRSLGDLEAPGGDGAVTNNRGGSFEFEIPDQFVDLVYPLPNDRLTGPEQRLYASSRQPFAPYETYTFEVATSRDFATFIGLDVSGQGLISVVPSTPFGPGTYYWRVRGADDVIRSEVSAFVVPSPDEVSAPPGLAYFDAANGRLPETSRGEGLLVDSTGSLAFADGGFFVTLVARSSGATGRAQFVYDFNSSGSSIFGTGAAYPGLAIAVYDVEKHRFTVGSPEDYPGLYAATERVALFSTESAEGREVIRSYLGDVAPGNYVWVFSSYETEGAPYDFAAWDTDADGGSGETLQEFLRGEGSERVGDWTARGEGSPWYMIYRKGEEVLEEGLGDSFADVLRTETFVPRDISSGTLTFREFPPARAYHELRLSLGANPDGANVGVELVYRDATGNELVAPLADGDVVDLSDRGVGPGSEMGLRVTQDVSLPNQDAAEVEFALTYTPLPDAAFSPLTLLERPADTLVAGLADTLRCAIANASPQPMGAGTIVGRRFGTAQPVFTTSFDSIPAFGSTTLTYPFEATSATGEENIVFTVEPSEPERSSTNNRALISRSVYADETESVVRFVLDGVENPLPRSITKEPTIAIVLVDDVGQGLDDPANLVVELVPEGGDPLEGLPGELTLTESRGASSGQNARVRYEYRPGPLPDGVYVLEVRHRGGAGQTGVTSGTARLTFEVINATTVSAILPYPNPAVDNVRFQYEATGEAIDDYQIDIYTTSGRLVRSLRGTDLGSLKVGRHLTDLAWDGTDNYGNRLARGTYLYRFAANVDGEDLEHRATGVDEYVKSNFGKLVLLR